ncbi:MAG TPA: ABC transporter permease, partial [Puia sp.]
MLKNYFKTALRSLLHNRLFTILNILGLATGLACSILIMLWVINESGYDRFNRNVDRTFRIITTVRGEAYPMTGAPMGEALKAQIPGIKYAARLIP